MKLVVLISWVFFSSAYLFLLNSQVPDEISWEAYGLFTVMLVGGGLSYDIASKIYSIPDFRNGWGKLFVYMFIVFLGHSTVLGGLFLAALLNDTFPEIISIAIGLSVSIIGFISSCVAAFKSEVAFKRLQFINN